jgi:hypothetical protein
MEQFPIQWNQGDEMKNLRLSLLLVIAMCGLLAAQDPPPREAPPAQTPPPAQTAPPTQTPPAQDPPPREAPSLLQSPTAAQTPPPAQVPPPAQFTEIPAGTPIHVRTIEAIDSRTADLNRQYAASLSEAIFVNGQQMAPRNADVRLRVVEDKKAGAVSGRTTLVLQVASVRINSQVVYVDTGTTVKESGSQGEKTATRGIVGGLLGAGIGALAGGGKGAVIGAGAGGAAGVASAMISGEQVRVKPETRLDFSLSQAAQVPAPDPNAPPPPTDYAPPRYSPPQGPPPPQNTYRVGGWAVTVDRCILSPDGGSLECRFSILNERRGGEVWIGGDSSITDLDGNRQRAYSVCLGPGRCLPDGARARVFPQSSINGRVYFGRMRLGDTIDRLMIRVRWMGGDEPVEFRGVRVEPGR